MSAEAKLEPEDYLWPLSTLRDTLAQPGATLPTPKLRSIFTYHLERLRTPWRRAKSGSKDGPNALSQATVSPVPGVQVEIDETTRKLATGLAEAAGIAGLDACLIAKSYLLYERGSNEEVELEMLLVWYSAECLALAEIVLLVLHLSRENEDNEWVQLAADIREGMIQDPAEYMENLFKGWAGLVQQELKARSAHALFWCTHQLRLQSAILDILFLVLYQTPERPVKVSEGLIRGFVSSGFGTAQANRDIWESDAESLKLANRIRDLSLIIVIESFGLAGVVTPGEEELTGSLLKSKDSIISLHLFINEQTADLTPSEDASATVFPLTPTPLVCLAWAILLHSLPPDRLPPNPGYEGQLYQEMAARALATSSGLFPWLEEILIGPLSTTATEDKSETFRRKVLKDLLIGLADLVQNIPDRPYLYRIWNILFSTGSPSTSLALSADYWVADQPYPLRRTILDQSEFPHNPVILPDILSALSGISAEDASKAEIFDVRPIQKSAEYFSNLYTIVIPTDPGWYRFVGKDEGRMLVEAAKDLVLPGGAIIQAGAQGSVLRTDGEKQIVSWTTHLPGWTILVEIMKVALGMRGIGDQEEGALSVADLGVQGETAQVLSAGMRLLSCAIKPISGLATGVLGLIPGGHFTILELAFAVLQQTEATFIPAAISSLDIIVSVSHLHPSAIFSALRSTSFFGVPGRKRGLAYSLIHLDSARAEHDVTLSVIRLVQALTTNTEEIDDGVIRAGIYHTFQDVWSMFTGWRYTDPGKKWKLSARLCDLYESVLAHPVDGITLTPAAQAVIDVLITSASTVTYRPLFEILSSAGRSPNASSTESAIKLLSALFRVGMRTGVSANNLPFSLMSASVPSEKTTLADYLFRSAISSTPLLKLLRTWLESTSLDAQKPSLAGLLRNAETTCTGLCRAAEGAAVQRAAAWDLLATIVTTQPGCAPACIGTNAKIAPPLDLAIQQITNTIPDTSDVLSACLSFLTAVFHSPSAHSVIPSIRTKTDFWKAVFIIATSPVPTPPTFQLSLHSPDFATRITAYAYSTQARANATALLAAELQLLDDEEKSPALESVLGAWRNGEKLGEMVGAAMYSGCEPELQVREAKRVELGGVRLGRWRTTRLDREYGMEYLYESEHQSVVNLGIDLLNLNWSMLDADIALTKSFRSLAEAVTTWTEDDALAARASSRAALVIAEVAADETRAGDVMLSVQTERLSILALLLETAFAEGTEDDLLILSEHIRSIVESANFPPIASLRQPGLLGIHRPTLRILQLLFARLSNRAVNENLVESGGSFILEAADIALDSIRRGTGQPSDLALTITPLCEMINLKSTVWLDKLSSSTLIHRSLELINRVRIQSDNVPAYLPSILLLHLALANHPRAAEKLAVSGILPAYSDNAIATEAEYGRIAPSPGEYSVHSAWCGMLSVVKTLLAALPDTASFVRSDVIPFIRLTTAQTVRSLSWDDTPISYPAIEELKATLELFHSVSRSIGANISLLSDFSGAVLPLLMAVRYALNHPRLFSTQIIPTEDEQEGLTKELEVVEGQQEVVLVDFVKTPILASRTADLIDIARTALLTLVGLSGAWDTMTGVRDPDDGLVILSEEEVVSASNDSIGIINDLQTLANSISEKVSTATTEGTSLLRVCHQLAEASSVLSASQILLRRSLLPAPGSDDIDITKEEKKGRRVSLSSGNERDRAEGILREVEGDWRGIIGGDGAVGDRGLMRWLEEQLDRAFEEMEQE